MHVTVSDPIQITSGIRHHAFTSCASWQNAWWVAYREAETHHPFPPGVIVIKKASHLFPNTTTHDFDSRMPPALDTPITFHGTTTIACPDGVVDFRDPRLIASDGVLYCLFGAYLPTYPTTTISRYSSDNIIQSFVTYTEDGHQWAPPQRVGRPGYWIWSALPLKTTWAAAAYHVGCPGEASSIHLLSSASLLTLRTYAMMYNGDDITREGAIYRYGHASVAEPVLYQPCPGTLACLLRAEDTDLKDMEIGVAVSPYQDWRWHRTGKLIHPSAVLQTPYGLLMAGRELQKEANGWDLSTALYHLSGTTVRRLRRMPSANDTGYAGLCPGTKDNEVLLSYYSQHDTPTPYGVPLPGAHVFVATITVDA